MIYLKRDLKVHPSNGTGNSNGQQKTCNLFCNIAATELKSDFVRFTTHVQTCQQPDLVQDRFDVGGKTRKTSLFNSFCSDVARQVVRFLLPVFPYLKIDPLNFFLTINSVLIQIK